MSMRTLEASILQELRMVTKNNRLRRKDIVSWSTGKVGVLEGETLYFLPKLKINVAVAVSVKP